MDPHTPPTPFSLLSSLLPPPPILDRGGGRRKGFLIPALNCHIILVGVWRWLEGRWGGTGGGKGGRNDYNNMYIYIYIKQWG